MDDDDLLSRADALLHETWEDMAKEIDPPSMQSTTAESMMRHTFSGVSSSSVHNPSEASLAMGWPELPKQWTTDTVGVPADYKTLYEPDPSIRNEELHAGLRGYFSTPLADPGHDFARQKVPLHLKDRAQLLDAPPADDPMLLKPDDRLAQTSTHLLRKTHSGAVKEWLAHQKVLLANAYPTEILPRLHKTFRNSYRERKIQALELEREARGRRAELRRMQKEVRSKVQAVKQRRADLAADQAKHEEVEAYCQALHDHSRSRWTETEALHAEFEALRARRDRLLVDLGPLPDGLAAGCTLAGIQARTLALQREVEAVEQW